MIRCIQVGRSTIQGHVSATWPDPTGEHGAIRSMGRVVMGRLTPQERGNIEKFDSAVEGVTEHDRLIRAEWVGFLRGRSSAFRDMAQERGNLQKPQIAPTVGGAVEVCPLCDIAGCRHIREAGNG